MDTQINLGRLAALLAWYREMGVTAALDPEPANWRAKGNLAPGAGYVFPSAEERPLAADVTKVRMAAPAVAPSERPPHQPRPSLLPDKGLLNRPQPPVRAFATDAGAAQARSVSSNLIAAGSLAELRAALEAFDGCGLKATAKSLCLYRGAETARLMIIGEAPGREEDMAGKPFVGPAGQLLDKMLAAIGLGEGDVHIANVVYWRPPGNRTPSPQEVQACAPYLAKQIELVRPSAIILLGGAAAKAMLATEEGIMRLRGKWREIETGGRSIPAMATLHPAYVLRAPASKRQVWRDLLAVRAAL